MNSSKRRHTPTAVELSVLSRSKRRCALCFALTGDLTEKHGQVAHLDHNPANWADDNLAFLCLNHHSVYDSTTSQHKNYTLAEVKKARDDLYTAAERDQHTPAPPKVYETQSEEAFASRRTKWYKNKKYLTGSIILPVILAVFGWIYNYQNSSRTESITNSRPSNSITSAPSNTGIITQGQNGNITINQPPSQDAIDALHISERAYITIDSPNLSIPDKAITLPLSNTGRIPSGNIQAIVHAAIFNSEISNNFNPETETPVELGWRRHRISPLPPGKDLITFAIPLREFTEAKYTPQGVFQIILVAGRVTYGDGFPHDGEQEWPFCYNTVYHTSLKKIFLVTCDAARWLPVLEQRDGYPNNEQRD